MDDTTPNPTPTLVLYESPISSFVQKVKIALREKNIPFTTQVPPDLASNTPSGPLHTANPRAEVPVLLVHTDTDTDTPDLQIFDSTIILEYIEDQFPSARALRPASSAARARARMIEEICDTEYEATNWGIAEIKWFDRGAFDPELQRAMLEKGAGHVACLQRWLGEKLSESAGGFFGGEEFGYVDACVAPIVNRSVTLGMGVADERLAAWLERVRGRESVRLTFGEYERALPGMGLLKEAIAKGERRREYRTSRLEWIVKSGGLQIVRDGIEKDTVRFTWPDNKQPVSLD